MKKVTPWSPLTTETVTHPLLISVYISVHLWFPIFKVDTYILVSLIVMNRVYRPPLRAFKALSLLL